MPDKTDSNTWIEPDLTDETGPRYGMVGASEIKPDNSEVQIKDIAPFTKTLLDSGIELDTPAYIEAMNSLHKFRISKQDPVHGLHAIWVFLSAGLVMPADLKRWFADNLLLTLNSDGVISLDKAFGLTDAAGSHKAFTTHIRNTARSNDMFVIHWLVSDFGFSAYLAARLNHQRNVSNGVTELISPEYARVLYSTLKEKPEISISHINWQDARDYSLALLKTFDVDGLCPKDRANLHLAIEDVAATSAADWPTESDNTNEIDDDWIV